MRCVFCTIGAATLAFGVISSMATAQQGSSTQQAISANPASNSDQELGRRFIIKAENLPPPKSDPVAASRSLLIPYAGQTPRVMEGFTARSEEHTSELQSLRHLVCRLLLEKKKKNTKKNTTSINTTQHSITNIHTDRGLTTPTQVYNRKQ